MESIGKSLERVDGRLKVTGAARYTAEWDIPNLAYGAVVSSAIASGSVRSIDASDAKKVPGVFLVMTHLEAPRLQPLPEKVGGTLLRGEGGMCEERQPLQDGSIYYADQALAVVVADTLERARYAATLVKVEYTAEKGMFSLETSTKKEFPASFVGSKDETLQTKIGDPEGALAAAQVRLKEVYDSAITHHNPIESLTTIASWESRNGQDFLTVHDSTRALENIQEVMSTSFNVPRENVQVICPFVGGAFGAKAWTLFNPLLVAMAAKAAKRPVKIEWRRQDMFSVAGQRAATRQTFQIGANTDGKITVFQHDTATQSSMVSGFVEPCARVTRMMYGVPNMGFTHELARLNLPSPCPMRGPGETVGSFPLECALDELATQLKIDPVELRLINYAEKNPETGKPWSGKHLRECYSRGKELIGWDARNPAPRSMRRGNNLIGYGMATTMYGAGRRVASAKATIFPDGRGLVQSATHEVGNGSYTIFRQISADGFSLPVERVRFELGDSSFPSAPVTGGSVTTATVGPAAFEAAQNAVNALKRLALADAASPLFGATEDAIDAAEGRLFLKSEPSKSEDYGSIIRRAKLPNVIADAETKPGEERQKYSFYSFGAIFAEVRVDEMSGSIRVARLCGVFDAGRVINPKMADSQVLGGMALAIGATLMEETSYDSRNGRAVIRNLADYHIPSCADTPDYSIEWLNIPDPHISKQGARGVGEMGCVGTAAAIANAVFHATGQRFRSLPLTPDKLVERLVT